MPIDGPIIQKTHWEIFINEHATELIESIRHGGAMQVRVSRPSQAPTEEIVFQCQFLHPVWGARTEELILFRDGTWRYIPR